MTKRIEFDGDMLQMMENSAFLPRLISSNEPTFHLGEKLNRHNVRICGLENPRTPSQNERDSAELNVFCALSQAKVYEPFIFVESAVKPLFCLNLPKIQKTLFSNRMELRFIGTVMSENF